MYQMVAFPCYITARSVAFTSAQHVVVVVVVTVAFTSAVRVVVVVDVTTTCRYAGSNGFERSQRITNASSASLCHKAHDGVSVYDTHDYLKVTNSLIDLLHIVLQ
jgi:acyl-CoA thioesterase FadM